MYNFYSTHGDDAFIYKNYISNNIDNGIFVEYTTDSSACSSHFFKETFQFTGDVVDKIVDFIIAVDNTKYIDILFIHAGNNGFNVLESMNWSIPVYIIAFEISHNKDHDDMCRELFKQHGYSFDNSIGNIAFYIKIENCRYSCDYIKNDVMFSFKSYDFVMSLANNNEKETILVNSIYECKFINLQDDFKSELISKLGIKPRLILLTFGSDVYYESVSRLIKTAANVTHFLSLIHI
jgi:hypothetical protein